jgi:hypothetical protein
MNSANKWMPKWESNGWKTSSGAPVANRGELERFADAKKGMDVTVVRIFVCLHCMKFLAKLFSSASKNFFRKNATDIMQIKARISVFQITVVH